MKLKTPRESKSPPKKRSKPQDLDSDLPKKFSLFDHVKHIRSIQDPEYYVNLSDENKKSFNHFMILRALSMDSDIVGEMAYLYRYFDKIPSPQFYQLLIALVPKSTRWVPWIKTKIVKHNQDMITAIGKHYEISKRQANEYVNVLIKSDDGLSKLVDLLGAIGFNETDIDKFFDKPNYEKSTA